MSEKQCPPAAPSVRPGIFGRLFIVSAPSGAGKTTLCRRLLARHPDLLYSVSHTTRKPRPGETDGVDYHFISIDAFKEGIENGMWAEWAWVHGNYYGTSARFLDAAIQNGRTVLLDIDIQGAAQIAGRFPDSVTIFIVPPTMDELKRRLSERNTDDPETVLRRMQAAEREMAERHRYDHIVVNDDVPRAVAALSDILTGKIRSAASHAR